MNRDDLTLMVIFSVFGLLLIIFLGWIGWKPLPVVEFAYGEEPCIRATTSYQRNYLPEGVWPNRRPIEWQTCTPWE